MVPVPVAELQARAAAEGWISYWGHENTRAAVAVVLGFDPAPVGVRPALALDGELLPCLGGRSFCEVWVLSPDYQAGFRPAIGKEVEPADILGWQCLRIIFKRE